MDPSELPSVNWPVGVTDRPEGTMPPPAAAASPDGSAYPTGLLPTNWYRFGPFTYPAGSGWSHRPSDGSYVGRPRLKYRPVAGSTVIPWNRTVNP